MGIGLLRVLLALSVVIAHSQLIYGYNIVNGMLAVQSFYIISGFYMSMILNEKYASAYMFYSNRALRLYPIYWCVLILTLLWSLFVPHSEAAPNPLHYFSDYYTSPFTLCFLIFTNLMMLGQDAILFFGLDHIGRLFFTTNFYQTDPMLCRFLFVPQAWTLGVEILFYLIAPFIVRRNVKVLVLIGLCSLIIRIILSRYGLSVDPWNYRFFPNELFLFVLGSIAYRVYKKYKDVRVQPNFIYLMIMYVFVFTLFYQIIPMNYHIKHWLYCVSIFAALPCLFRYSKNNRVDRSIGDLSYIIYISHILIVKISQWGGGGYIRILA